VNGNGFADPGKYAFIVEVRDRAGNLVEGKWGGTCWIQDNVLDLVEPDRTEIGGNNPRPRYFSPNGDGSLDSTKVFFRVNLGVTPSECLRPERISVFSLPDIAWNTVEVKAIGTYTVRVFDESKAALIRTIVENEELMSNKVLSEVWDGRNDAGQYVPEGNYQIEIDARDFIGGPALHNLLTFTVTVDKSSPRVVSNEPQTSGATPWRNGKDGSGNPVTYTYDVDFFDDHNAYASKLEEAWYKIRKPNGTWTEEWAIFTDLNSNSYVDNWGPDIFGKCGEGTNEVRVRALDYAGNQTSEVLAFYVKRDTNPPGANQPSTTSPTNNRRPTWNWTVSSDLSGVQGYYLKLGTSAGGGNVVGETWIGNTISWTTTTNLGDGTYYATIKAKDNAGNTGDWGSSGQVTVDISSPEITGISDSPDPFSPGNPDGNKDSITFNFTINEPATVSIYVDGSRIYHEAKAAGNHSFTWTQSECSYLFEGLHNYYIYAADGVGNPSTSSTYGFTVDNTPPVAPLLSATSGNGVANLSWNSVDDISGYHVYKSDAYNGTYGRISGLLSAAMTSYQNTGLSNGIRYWYKVVAIDSAGNEGFSNYVAAVPGRIDASRIYFMKLREWNYVGTWRASPNGSDLSEVTYLGEDFAFSSNGNKVVLPLLDRDRGTTDIYMANLDLTGRVRLTDNYVDEGCPSFYSDDTKIIFNRGNEIWIMRTDRSMQAKITNGVYPQISPDGQMVVFNREWNVWMADIDGNNFTQLTTDGNSIWPRYWGMSFSPDGTKILFIKDCAYSATRGTFSEIYLMDIRTKNITCLHSGYQIYKAKFSPDGTKIVFVKGHDVTVDGVSYVDRDLFIMNLDGSSVINITNDPDKHDDSPVWAPFCASIGGLSIPVTTTQSTTLEAPTLIAPEKDKQDVNSIRPAFEWEHRKGNTEEYKIDLAKDDAFAFDHQTFTKDENTGSPDKNDPTLYHYTYAIHEFDPGLERNTDYYWKVTAFTTSEAATSEVWSFRIQPDLTLTGVTNYPNPFNPNHLDPNQRTTKIRYRLSTDADEVKIRIYDIVGSLVVEIPNCASDGEGPSIWQKYNEVDWNGRNGRGDIVMNGIYPFEIIARLGDKSVSGRGKIAVLK
jgi:flagellar hook assembly protein FlgD